MEQQQQQHSNWTDFHIGAFFENLSRKFKFRENLTRITLGYFTCSRLIYIFIIIILELEMFQTKKAENMKTHFVFNNDFRV